MLFLTFQRMSLTSCKSFLDKENVNLIDLNLMTFHQFCMKVMSDYGIKCKIISNEQLNEYLKEMVIRQYGLESLNKEKISLGDDIKSAFLGDYKAIQDSLNISINEIQLFMQKIAQAGIVSFDFLIVIVSWIIKKGYGNKYAHIFLDDIDDFQAETILSIINLAKNSCSIACGIDINNLKNGAGGMTFFDLISNNPIIDHFGSPKVFKLGAIIPPSTSIIKNAIPYEGLNSIPQIIEDCITGLKEDPSQKLSIAFLQLPSGPRMKLQNAVDEWIDENLAIVNKLRLEISTFSINSIKGLTFDFIILILEEALDADIEQLTKQFYVAITRTKDRLPYIVVKPQAKGTWERIALHLENKLKIKDGEK